MSKPYDRKWKAGFIASTLDLEYLYRFSSLFMNMRLIMIIYL